MMRVTGCSTPLWSMLPAGPALPRCPPPRGPAAAPAALGAAPEGSGSGRAQRPGPNFPGEPEEPIAALALREPRPQGIAACPARPRERREKEQRGSRNAPTRARPNQTSPPAAPPRPPAAPPRKMETGSGGAAPAPRRSRPAPPGGAQGPPWRAGPGRAEATRAGLGRPGRRAPCGGSPRSVPVRVFAPLRPLGSFTRRVSATEKLKRFST